MQQSKSRIFVALDVPTLPEALALVEQVHEYVAGFKVGLELCSAVGVPQVVEAVNAAGGSVFLDLKLHDIPITVAGAVRAVTRNADSTIRILTLHCSGGSAMLRAAATVTKNMPERPRLLGVTVLTSLDQRTLGAELGVARMLENQALHLAQVAQESGMDGVVASPHECTAIKRACGDDFLVITPGIRPAWSARGDQHRFMTPVEAVRAGADYLVIGRPITAAPASSGGPAAAAARIVEELQNEEL